MLIKKSVVLEGKADRELSESSRLQFSKKILVLQIAIGLLPRRGIADLHMLRELFLIC